MFPHRFHNSSAQARCAQAENGSGFLTITDMIQLAGGVALFLYGMTIMGAGLEKVAGGKMQSILQKLTSSTIRGILLGTFPIERPP